MWITKFRIYDKENELRRIIEKCKVEVIYYPLNHYIKKQRYFFIAVGIVRGNDTDFFGELKKLKNAKRGRKVEFLESEGDFFVVITSHTINQEEKRYVNMFYNPSIIHHQPIVFHRNGWEEWEIASLEKKAINDIIEIGKNVYELTLLRFYWKKIRNFGFLALLPELTVKQERALQLALKYGYYQYPRAISVDKLSKIARVSFSTFQAHLRKAENKILPFVITGLRNKRL